MNSPNVVTASVPHVMYYAPNVTNKQVGGSGPGSPYPHIILTGAHGYNIQLIGSPEKEVITKGYEKMLTKLCAIKKSGAFQPANNNTQPVQHHHD